MPLKTNYALLKTDPATGEYAPGPGSGSPYQHLAHDGATWTTGEDYRRWPTLAEAEAFAAAAGLAQGEFRAVPRFIRKPDGGYETEPEDTRWVD